MTEIEFENCRQKMPYGKISYDHIPFDFVKIGDRVSRGWWDFTKHVIDKDENHIIILSNRDGKQTYQRQEFEEEGYYLTTIE